MTEKEKEKTVLVSGQIKIELNEIKIGEKVLSDVIEPNQYKNE